MERRSSFNGYLDFTSNLSILQLIQPVSLYYILTGLNLLTRPNKNERRVTDLLEGESNLGSTLLIEFINTRIVRVT